MINQFLSGISSKAVPGYKTVKTEGILNPIEIRIVSDKPKISLGEEPKEKLDDETITALLMDGLGLEEEGKLEEAYEKFKKAAENGSAIGNYFIGMMVRHGIGTEKNENLGYAFLYRGLEKSLNNNSSNMPLTPETIETLPKYEATTSNTGDEQALILLEIGMCALYGWGIKKNPSAAFQYFSMSAQLGDSDALIEVAKCLLNGIGTKKNKHLAAKCYRLAEEAGNVVPCNSWIYKEKYLKE